MLQSPYKSLQTGRHFLACAGIAFSLLAGAAESWAIRIPMPGEAAVTTSVQHHLQLARELAHFGDNPGESYNVALPDLQNLPPNFTARMEILGQFGAGGNPPVAINLIGDAVGFLAPVLEIPIGEQGHVLLSAHYACTEGLRTSIQQAVVPLQFTLERCEVILESIQVNPEHGWQIAGNAFSDDPVPVPASLAPVLPAHLPAAAPKQAP